VSFPCWFCIVRECPVIFLFENRISFPFPTSPFSRQRTAACPIIIRFFPSPHTPEFFSLHLFAPRNHALSGRVPMKNEAAGFNSRCQSYVCNHPRMIQFRASGETRLTFYMQLEMTPYRFVWCFWKKFENRFFSERSILGYFPLTFAVYILLFFPSPTSLLLPPPSLTFLRKTVKPHSYAKQQIRSPALPLPTVSQILSPSNRLPPTVSFFDSKLNDRSSSAERNCKYLPRGISVVVSNPTATRVDFVF